ncbi:V-type proton ATPase subunit G 1 [Tupaia chinensis]|uniref:V-type proton ATPase subunit G 1 n=1 Tax=Tupaia chinensis TaxID=246437 RepID=L9KG58_TUPCH|nr:V-type proton ATPase subunit G 1 [Tupaia chinensis]
MLPEIGSLLTALWSVLHLRTLLLGAVVFLFFADFLKRRHPKNYPPGPRSLPFVGHLLLVDFEQAHLKLQKYVKKYGNLLSLEIGDMSSVLISGLPLIKETLTHMEQNFMNRPITSIRKRVFKQNASRRGSAVAAGREAGQQLLQAEKRAAEKVSEARKQKNQRLKQAKAAQAETEQYRLQREKEFKAKEAAVLGSHSSCSTEVEKETQEKMTILQNYFLQNRNEVLDNLLTLVCDIQPEIHENYHING